MNFQESNELSKANPYIITRPCIVSEKEIEKFYTSSAQLHFPLAEKAIRTRLTVRKEEALKRTSIEILTDFNLPIFKDSHRLHVYFFVRSSEQHDTYLLDCCRIFGTSFGYPSPIFKIKEIDLINLKRANLAGKVSVSYNSYNSRTEKEANALIELWKAWADIIISDLKIYE